MYLVDLLHFGHNFTINPADPKILHAPKVDKIDPKKVTHLKVYKFLEDTITFAQVFGRNGAIQRSKPTLMHLSASIRIPMVRFRFVASPIQIGKKVPKILPNSWGS
jgi:hypothetical protein